MERFRQSLNFELWEEIIYIISLLTIIFWCAMIIDIMENQVWVNAIQNWDYNTITIPTGWEDAAVWE